MDAAPPAPASPEPTMITVYLRLLDGLTSFISKRCRSHFFSMGPDGMLARSSIRPPGLLDAPEKHGERERDVAGDDQDREDPGAGVSDAHVARMRDSERLAHAPHPVPQVQTERHH